MSNLGLKPYAKQLEFKTTLGTFFCNLSKTDKNVILEIPLISTPDGMKYPISLIYNYLNRTTSSSYGNGGLLSLYASFSYRGSSVSQMKCDGASYSYSLSSGKFISEDSGDYATYDSGTFILYSSGYSYEYNGNAFHLYNKITSPNGDTLTMTSSSSSLIIYETNYGSKVKIQYSSSQKTKAISYNGSSITYLDNGYFYPVSLNGAALSYSDGKLASHTKNGTLTTYAYNMYGLRESKTKDGVTVQYVYENDKLISLIHPSYTFYFLYDGDEPYGFIYSNNVYYYMKDITGIIRGIVNTNGSIVVEYSYTSYGRIQSVTGSLSSTIGTYNPLRYKGYFYDEESGYYYCKSRYYVPFLGRWLTPDDPKCLDDKSHCGFNPYVYCNDNPVMYSDEEGEFALSAFILNLLALAIPVGISYGMGKIEYVIWNKIGWINYNKNGDIEIKHSWLIPDPVSQIAFLLSVLKVDNSNGISNARNIFSLTLEWSMHNIATVIGGIGLAITFIPGLLTSGGIISRIFYYILTSGKDAYLDNDYDWWKIWKRGN